MGSLDKLMIIGGILLFIYGCIRILIIHDPWEIIGPVSIFFTPIIILLATLDQFVWSQRDPKKNKDKILVKSYLKIARSYENAGDIVNAEFYYGKAEKLYHTLKADNGALIQRRSKEIVKKPLIKPRLQDIEGIGEELINKLNKIGINTLKDLTKEYALEIAPILELDEMIVQSWIDEAKNKWDNYLHGI